MTLEELFARFSRERLGKLDSSIEAASSSRHGDGKSAGPAFAYPRDEGLHPCGSRGTSIEAFSDALHRWFEQQNAPDRTASPAKVFSSRLNAIETGNPAAGVGMRRPPSGSTPRTPATRRSRKSKGGESESRGTKS